MIKNKTMRITGGLLVRRLFLIPPLLEEGVVRPASDRLRESLFASIKDDLLDAQVLDLFAGSGAYGFESLSRGAQKVVFIEKNHLIYECLKTSIKNLGLETSIELVLGDAQKFVLNNYTKFDVIFLDPPFALKLSPEFFKNLSNFADASTMVIFRCFKKEAPLLSPDWVIVKEKMYGSSKVFFISLKPQGEVND